ncbi:MAG: lysylphosphatidylglycerol synthase domain-containing protein, partial [Bacteroidia bacterium]
MKSWLLGVLRQLKPGAPRAAHQRLAGNLLKYGIMIAAISYIVWRLDREDSSVWDMLAGMNAQSWILVALAFVLIFLNLGLEAMKWRTMVRPVYPDLTLQKAFGAVVVGITAGIFTPNGIGAYAGRVFWLKAGKR